MRHEASKIQTMDRRPETVYVFHLIPYAVPVQGRRAVVRSFAPPLALPPAPPAPRKRCFTAQEDERLIEIMGHHPPPMKCREWSTVAAELGGAWSAKQCLDRWGNSLRPPLDRSEIPVEERRELLRLAVAEKGNWRGVVAHNTFGKIRARARVKNILVCLLKKLKGIGIALEAPGDVDFLTEEVFRSSSGKCNAIEYARMRDAFLENKAAACGPAYGPDGPE